jgi:hypothetical protein
MFGFVFGSEQTKTGKITWRIRGYLGSLERINHSKYCYPASVIDPKHDVSL